MCQVWLKWAQWIWRRRFFLNFVNVFSLFHNYLPLEKAEALHLKKMNPLHPRMHCANFGWNGPSGSGEEDENVKSLQTDRRTDRRRTKSYQKSSLELSAQVSLKVNFDIFHHECPLCIGRLILRFVHDCNLNIQVVFSANCMCPCSRVNTPKNFTDEEIAEAIKIIKKKLLVNIKNLSSTRRKKISVMDSRPSSQSIGAFGALVIASIVVVFFAFDFSILVGHIRNAQQRLQWAFRNLLRAMPLPG